MKERATVVCRQQDKILLVTRGRSRWSLPGGTIRRSESPVEAARRELIEETALAVDGFTFLFEFGGLTKRHHVFLVDLAGGRAPTASTRYPGAAGFGPNRCLTSSPACQPEKLSGCQLVTKMSQWHPQGSTLAQHLPQASSQSCSLPRQNGNTV
jgi:ADP-ribose pyrophosphatase YjhB (NUDIX family)